MKILGWFIIIKAKKECSWFFLLLLFIWNSFGQVLNCFFYEWKDWRNCQLSWWRRRIKLVNLSWLEFSCFLVFCFQKKLASRLNWQNTVGKTSCIISIQTCYRIYSKGFFFLVSFFLLAWNLLFLEHSVMNAFSEYWKNDNFLYSFAVD